MRHGVALVLGQRLHKSRHVEIVGAMPVGKAVHGARPDTRSSGPRAAAPARRPRNSGRWQARHMVIFSGAASGGRAARARRPGLGREIIADLAQILQAERLDDQRHDRVAARAAVVVVQFLVEIIGLLAPDDRRGRRSGRYAVLAVTCGANPHAYLDVVRGRRRTAIMAKTTAAPKMAEAKLLTMFFHPSCVSRGPSSKTIHSAAPTRIVKAPPVLSADLASASRSAARA